MGPASIKKTKGKAGGPDEQQQQKTMHKKVKQFGHLIINEETGHSAPRACTKTGTFSEDALEEVDKHGKKHTKRITYNHSSSALLTP